MRLVCPNCDAKYEVPEDAIPETGRDVQCANCGHAWFQMRRVAEVAPVASPPVAAPAAPPAAPVVATVAAAAPPAPEPLVAPPVPEPEPEPVVAVPEPEPVVPSGEVATAAVIEEAQAADAEPVEEPAPEAAVTNADPVIEDVAAVEAATTAPMADDLAAAAEPVAETSVVETPMPEPVAETVSAASADPVAKADLPDLDEADPVDIPASTGAIAAAGVAAYAVDESVLAILREEAEREAHARKADTAKPLETQTDLGLDAAMTARRTVSSASDLVSGDETAEDRQSVRRTRLPDVEEINSTLRPSDVVESEVEPAAMAAAPEGRSGFRSGFLLVMTLAILASALYGSADAIASAVPALAGPLKGFVGFVDSLRLQLDGLMQSATVAIDGN